MTALTGPLVYLSGLAGTIAFSYVVLHGSTPLLVFPVTYFLFLGFSGWIGWRWPGNSHQESAGEYHESIVILGVAVALNQLVFGDIGAGIGRWLSAQWLPAAYTDAIRSLPFWPATLIALLVYETVGFLQHRCMHYFEFLWDRVHSVHHEPRSYGVALTMRLSHVEYLISHLTRGLAVQFLQLDSAAIGVAMSITLYAAVVSHTNTSLRFGFLNRWINTPEVHMWHHARGGRGNYSVGLFVLLDVLTGTYRCPGERPGQLGIEGFPRRRSAWDTIALKPLQGSSHAHSQSAPLDRATER